ncbi:MAG: methyltransferase type 12 [Planctomycetes bacterium]|nr:methyltransferase type 12 [Planctomycetota bacterium]
MVSLPWLSEWLEKPTSRVNPARSPQDGMFDDENHYASVGRSALRLIRLALLTAGHESVERILDLACGHGRVLRMLQAAFPDAELTACDVDRHGVDFCAATFGATPVYSTPELRAVRFDGTYDLIWAGSVLTHLPRSRWLEFSECALRALERGGVLVFTTHGRRAAMRARAGDCYLLDPGVIEGLLDEFESTGFASRDYPAQKGYGVSFASPDWVIRELLGLDALRLVGFAEGAWDEHQDVIAVQRV